MELSDSYAPLPETVQQLTGGGGVQYLFAHPGTPVKNGVETLGVGLDIRGDGGYIIAPPSLHASGQHYAWELSYLPEETPLAPMPPWLLALCQETTRREVVDAGATIPDHHRNNTLFKLGTAMQARGFSHAAILGALQAINTTQCQPPLETAEVETIAASCAKYPAGTGGQNGRQQEQEAPPLDPDEPWPDAPQQRPKSTGPSSSSNGTRHAHQATQPQPQPTLITRATDGITEEMVEWLWWPYLAIGTLAMLDGEPGVGKSQLALALAAALSRGGKLPGQEGKLTFPLGDPAVTLLMSAEDSLAATIKPRLVKSRADCSKVIVVIGWSNAADPQGVVEAFTFEQLPLLEQGLDQYHPRLVVIDPIQAYLGGKVDINRANETRPLLAELARLAEQYRCAMVQTPP